MLLTGSCRILRTRVAPPTRVWRLPLRCDRPLLSGMPSPLGLPESLRRREACAGRPLLMASVAGVHGFEVGGRRHRFSINRRLWSICGLARKAKILTSRCRSLNSRLPLPLRQRTPSEASPAVVHLTDYMCISGRLRFPEPTLAVPRRFRNSYKHQLQLRGRTYRPGRTWLQSQRRAIQMALLEASTPVPRARCRQAPVSGSLRLLGPRFPLRAQWLQSLPLRLALATSVVPHQSSSGGRKARPLLLGRLLLLMRCRTEERLP